MRVKLDRCAMLCRMCIFFVYVYDAVFSLSLRFFKLTRCFACIGWQFSPMSLSVLMRFGSVFFAGNLCAFCRLFILGWKIRVFVDLLSSAYIFVNFLVDYCKENLFFPEGPWGTRHDSHYFWKKIIWWLPSDSKNFQATAISTPLNNANNACTYRNGHHRIHTYTWIGCKVSLS